MKISLQEAVKFSVARSILDHMAWVAAGIAACLTYAMLIVVTKQDLGITVLAQLLAFALLGLFTIRFLAITTAWSAIKRFAR